MTILTIDGLPYHFELGGEGPALMLLHGFTGSVASWGALREAFEQRYTVLALDLPGHGRTAAPQDVTRYTMEHVANDIVRLLDKVGIRQANLLGYSMGGRLALYLAWRTPGRWRSLALESASPGLKDESARQERIAADNDLAVWIEGHTIGDFVTRWENLPLFASQVRLLPGVRAGQRLQRLANTREGLANSLRGMGTGVQPSLWAELGTIKLPTLLVAGELDQKFVAINRAMSADLPASRLVVVPDAGHTVHLEQPDAFVARVDQFLALGENETAQQLAHAKQDREDQGRQGHLLEPGVETGQVGRPAHSQAIADQEWRRQQEEVLPPTALSQHHVGHGQDEGQG